MGDLSRRRLRPFWLASPLRPEFHQSASPRGSLLAPRSRAGARAGRRAGGLGGPGAASGREREAHQIRHGERHEGERLALHGAVEDDRRAAGVARGPGVRRLRHARRSADVGTRQPNPLVRFTPVTQGLGESSERKVTVETLGSVALKTPPWKGEAGRLSRKSPWPAAKGEASRASRREASMVATGRVGKDEIARPFRGFSVDFGARSGGRFAQAAAARRPVHAPDAPASSCVRCAD